MVACAGMPMAPSNLLSQILLMRTEQWLNPAELERRQWSRFQRVLRHAYDNSPFYARRFRDAGITPDDIRDRADLSRIPIVTRRELRHPEELVPDSYDPARMKESFSSGSTGESVRTYFDSNAWRLGKHLLKLRARWACGVRPWDRAALIQAGDFSNSEFRRRILRQQSFSVHRPVKESLLELRKFAPTVLYGFPTHFSELAEICNQDITPKCIFTSGEMLEDGTRRKIGNAFGAPVYDIYGSTELKEIAWECPRRDGYHINSDWVLVESVGEHDTIVVTSLYNYGMPLIRYELGDTGKLLDGLCRCGRSLPLMAPGVGRSVDYFQLPDGSRVSPYTLVNNVEVLPEIRQFQILQDTPDRVVVLVVPGPDYGDGSAERIRGAITDDLPGITIDIRCVDEIAREPSGKFRKVLSDLPRDESKT